jgi:hypothetical protein
MPVKPRAGVNVTVPFAFTLVVPLGDGSTIVTEPESSGAPSRVSLANTLVVTGVSGGVHSSSGLAVIAEAAASANR